MIILRKLGKGKKHLLFLLSQLMRSVVVDLRPDRYNNNTKSFSSKSA